MATWEQRLTELTRDRGPALLRYAYLLCGDRTEAADLVQEGLVRAFGRSRPLPGVEHLEAYVRRGIVTAYLDGQRRLTRWRAVRHLVVAAERQSGPEDGVLHREAVRRACAALSPRQRACLVLRYYGDLPVARVADHLGCSEGAVKRYLSEALARLAPLLRQPPGPAGRKEPMP